MKIEIYKCDDCGSTTNVISLEGTIRFGEETIKTTDICLACLHKKMKYIGFHRINTPHPTPLDRTEEPYLVRRDTIMFKTTGVDKTPIVS
jgi:hypothetical protein